MHSLIHAFNQFKSKTKQIFFVPKAYNLQQKCISFKNLKDDIRRNLFEQQHLQRINIKTFFSDINQTQTNKAKYVLEKGVHHRRHTHTQKGACLSLNKNKIMSSCEFTALTRCKVSQEDINTNDTFSLPGYLNYKYTTYQNSIRRTKRRTTYGLRLHSATELSHLYWRRFVKESNTLSFCTA